MRARTSDLAREGDYLRDGFEPTGSPQLTEESTTTNDVLVQKVPGRFAGLPAIETVTLVVDVELGTALVISRVTTDDDLDATREARTLESQVRRAFEDG